jgi:hypothetical protein
LAVDASWDAYFNGASKALLFLSGIAGCAAILYYVIRAYVQRKKVQCSISEPGESRGEKYLAHAEGAAASAARG